MKVVLLQPSYIPWRGFFHQIQKVDLFIHYDDAQYDKHGWRNRNLINTKNGKQWLTIPVLNKGNVENQMQINEARVNQSTRWAKKHWATIEQTYSKTPFFSVYAPELKRIFDNPPDLLTDFTIPLTEHLAGLLGLKSNRFDRSSRLGGTGTKTERILSILDKVGATKYISGPSAKNYLDEALFASSQISLEYMEYSYPAYQTSFPDAEGNFSILDLLFHHGPDSGKFIWGTPTQEQIQAA